MIGVQIGGRGDHRPIPRLASGVRDMLERAGEVISIGHFAAAIGVRIAQRHRAANVLKAAHMTLADRAAADHQHIYRHVQPPSTSRLAPVT
jgi:hypothetical protein